MIVLEDVSKEFRIPHLRQRTLFHRLTAIGRYRYETFAALGGVSLRIGRGEFVGIIGHNGCGKSTLLRIVAGIYPATRGRVRVNGSVSPVLDLGVGFRGTLRVRDNVLLYGVLLGVPRARLVRELAAILDEAGVRRFADAPLERLSTGLRVRLAFTIAMRAEADVLLVDEALAVGDEAFRTKSLALLGARKRAGATAVLVSHSPGPIQQLCDRVVVMEEGRVVAEGPTPEMLALSKRRAEAARQDASSL
jgi:ABC-type polysaccharide/polyol phosphate transport system ATPase subunit